MPNYVIPKVTLSQLSKLLVCANFPLCSIAWNKCLSITNKVFKMHSYINDLTDIEGHLLHNAIVTRLGKFTVRVSECNLCKNLINTSI